MTKDDYQECAEAFAKVLQGLRGMEEDFSAVLDYKPQAPGEELYDTLERCGWWLTGRDYADIQFAIATVERLTGRAYGRAL